MKGKASIFFFFFFGYIAIPPGSNKEEESTSWKVIIALGFYLRALKLTSKVLGSLWQKKVDIVSWGTVEQCFFGSFVIDDDKVRHHEWVRIPQGIQYPSVSSSVWKYFVSCMWPLLT